MKIENKNKKYIKLESVGSWFNTKTFDVFPIHKNESIKPRTTNSIAFLNDMVIDIEEVSDEFKDSLSDKDYALIFEITGFHI